eukprot:2505961-Pleurochrysis_carterae.AAC.1
MHSIISRFPKNRIASKRARISAFAARKMYLALHLVTVDQEGKEPENMLGEGWAIRRDEESERLENVCRASINGAKAMQATRTIERRHCHCPLQPSTICSSK